MMVIKRTMYNWLCSSLLVFVAWSCLAQTKPDSLLFSFDNYRQTVRTYHPVAMQANLQLMRGESAIRRARGNFDPKIQASFDNKEFQGKDYYSLTNAELKIPTAAAVELKAAYDLNRGDFLNRQEFTPDDGLLAVGLSLPLLQGLMMDERRTALAQAKAFNEFSKSEQRVILNDLLFASYLSYWEWWTAFEKQRIAADILRVAEERFTAVKQRALAGQAPIIDTVEANIQVLLRRQNLQDARAGEIKARMGASSFIWSAGVDNELSPRVLGPGYFPTLTLENTAEGNFAVQNFLILMDSIVANNPYLAQFEAKLTSVEAEARMKREKLKPKLNLNYNVLAESTGSASDANFSTNNYKWGMDFSFPLLLRGERGDLQLTRIKQAELKYEQQQKVQEVKNKARAVYEGYFLLQQQVAIAAANINNYAVLLEGERIKFFNGESSLFLVNQRELQFADAQNKLVELQAKLRIIESELAFYLGVID